MEQPENFEKDPTEVFAEMIKNRPQTGEFAHLNGLEDSKYTRFDSAVEEMMPFFREAEKRKSHLLDQGSPREFISAIENTENAGQKLKDYLTKKIADIDSNINRIKPFKEQLMKILK